jgi:hypothetical protein
VGEVTGWETTAAFAAWLGALLPRLVLYPGGLILVLAALLAWWAGRRPGRGDPSAALLSPPGAPAPALQRLALALAWVSAALLPLPGAAPWPLPPDLLVLGGLLLAAGAVTGAATPGGQVDRGLALSAGALAAFALAAGRLGLPLLPVSPLVAGPALLAYAWGLLSADHAWRAAGSDTVEDRTALSASSAPFSLSRYTFHLIWLSWVGLGGALLGAGARLGSAPLDAVLMGGLLLLAGALHQVASLRTLARRTQALGWVALGVALLLALLAL